MDKNIYDTKRWRALRQRILKRDKYCCQYFTRYGRHVDATTVHHIFPVEQYPQWAFESWNLISLSTEAHNKMHDRETHELTDEGYKLQDRLRRKLGSIPPPRKP